MLRRIAVLTVLACLSASTGCAYIKSNPRLYAQAPDKQMDDDLPVPDGFRMDPAVSYAHDRNDYRRFRLVYRQEEYLGEKRLKEFVNSYFPQKGWEVAFVYGLETLKFILYKGSEECRVEIMEDFGDRFTEVTYEVEPRKTPDGKLVARDSFGRTSLEASSSK